MGKAATLDNTVAVHLKDGDARGVEDD